MAELRVAQAAVSKRVLLVGDVVGVLLLLAGPARGGGLRVRRGGAPLMVCIADIVTVDSVHSNLKPRTFFHGACVTLYCVSMPALM